MKTVWTTPVVQKLLATTNRN